MSPSLPELYISVDIEASGPIPGEYSMLSLGACVVGEPTRNFYVEFVPLNKNFTRAAMATSHLSLATLRAHGTQPAEAMKRIARWVSSIAAGRRVVFVGFNASFDWSFVNYYFVKFLNKNPFGHAALDIKSYYMGLYGTSWSDTKMTHLPPDIHSPEKPLLHNALDDAMQQAEIFAKLLEMRSTTVDE